ncbi:MAG: MoxR family ATPase [Bacteroidota bacterium]
MPSQPLSILEKLNPYRNPSATLEGLPNLASLNKPENYIANTELARAIHVALLLKKPLLITGPPGTGKTMVAASIAHQLSENKENGVYEKPYRFTAKHDSVYKDLFYRYDSLRHFSDANTEMISIKGENPFEEIKEGTSAYDKVIFSLLDNKGREDAYKYIDFRAFGSAILRAKLSKRESKRRSVVLIDEIDKAPRAFPNDLLEALEDFRFMVDETAETFDITEDELKPIVIITSNREKELPDAFLRRCIYHHIGFPEPSQLQEIIDAQLTGKNKEGLRFSSDELDTLLGHFDHIRATIKNRKPATAELLSWLQVLDAYREFRVDKIKTGEQGQIERISPTEKEVLTLSYCVLLKHKDDMDRMLLEIDQSEASEDPIA